MEEATIVSFKIYSLEKDDISVDTLTECLKDHIQNYIWENENLTFFQENGGMVSGKVDVGTCLKDEWFLVYLMFILSEKFDNLVIQGEEFLLIEAADHLPNWLDSHVSENRVMIHKGQVHLIPKPSNPAEIGIYPSWISSVKDQVLPLISSSTLASENFQKCIRDKILETQEKIIEEIHKTSINVPIKIAYLLHLKPQLISKVTQVLDDKDYPLAKVCAEMKFFPPSSSILSTVTMTRSIYARISSLQVATPTCFGELNGFEQEIGMKIACGFEMLVSREYELQWSKYKHRLVELKYFGDLLPGSAEYVQRETTAKTDFENHIADSLLKKVSDLDISWLQNNSPNFVSNVPGDSLDWMNVTVEDLNEMMKKAGMMKEDEFLVKDMVNSFEEFMAKQSAYEGIDLDDDMGEEDEEEEEEEENMDPSVKKDVEMIKNMINVLKSWTPNVADLSDEENEVDDSSEEEDLMTDKKPSKAFFDVMGQLLEKEMSEYPYFKQVIEESTKQHEMFDSMERQMKDELMNDTNIFEGFEKNNEHEINEDVQLAKNVLEAHSAESGIDGPSSTLLSSLKIRPPIEE